MMLKNYCRLSVSGGTKPGRGEKFHQDNHRKMREEWGDFCTKHCPHPGKLCRQPCKEWRAKFGDRRDA